MKKLIPKESEIQNAVCEYLALRKYFFYRSNNIPISDLRNGKRFFRALPKYAVKGVPDITIITDGGFVCFLEIKRPGAKQSSEQKDFEKRCKVIGAEYRVITSVDQLKEIGL